MKQCKYCDGKGIITYWSLEDVTRKVCANCDGQGSIDMGIEIVRDVNPDPLKGKSLKEAIEFFGETFAEGEKSFETLKDLMNLF